MSSRSCRNTSMALIVGRISNSIFRRSASRLTSFITGDLPHAPVPTTSRWHFHGMSWRLATLQVKRAGFPTFQSGSPSIPNIYASVCGLELLRGIGMENVAGQVGQLTTALLQGAAEQGIQGRPLPTVLDLWWFSKLGIQRR